MAEINREQELIYEETRAVEAYEQLLSRIHGGVALETEETLKRLCEEHRHSQQSLLQLSQTQDPYPSHLSGGWESVVEKVRESDQFSGSHSIFKSLQQGEEHGLKTYEKAINDESLSPDIRLVIEDGLIQQQQQHIATLDSLIHNIEGENAGVSPSAVATGQMSRRSQDEDGSSRTLH